MDVLMFGGVNMQVDPIVITFTGCRIADHLCLQYSQTDV